MPQTRSYCTHSGITPSLCKGSDKSVESPHNQPLLPPQRIVSSSQIPCGESSHSPVYEQAGERRSSADISSPTNRKKLSTFAKNPSKVTVPTDCKESITRKRIRGFCESLISNGSADSADEIMFLTLVKTYGLRRAVEKAAILHLQCLRPLQALLEVTNEYGKNYSTRSAKGEGRSVSARSRKSRSGGALSSRMGGLE
jgi:hypothetical protein